MSVANRLCAIGVALIMGGLAVVVVQAVNARNWNEFSAIREADAFIARQQVRLTNTTAAVANAERAEREATMTGDERYQTGRYVGYGLAAIGALFALVGFAMSGASARPSDPSPPDGQGPPT